MNATGEDHVPLAEGTAPARRAPARSMEEPRLLRAALDGTTDSVFVKDLEGRYIAINAAGAHYIGRAVDEILGHDDRVFFPAETAAAVIAHDHAVLLSGQPHAFEVTLPVGGQPRVFFSTKTPYRDVDGHIVGLIGISRDITERKRAEEAQRESEERLARILESAMDAIVAIDEQRVVRLYNTAAEEVFKCPVTAAIGRSFDRFASPALRELLIRCGSAFEQHRVKKPYVWVPAGLSARRADGSDFPIEATISQVRFGTENWLTLILRDVNERQQVEEQLRKLHLEKLYLQEEMQASLSTDEMVGESPAIKKVRQLIEQVAATDSTVLITGETGTGKELVARAIHAHSTRKDAILVKVNCAALPAGLIESELFGHEKGAFTGALARRDGRFEMADGGTIFLDEIGELPLELQAKLLRVLQDGEFERVGGSKTLKVDVRIITATNRDLQRGVAEQRFRADLYYRLNVFPIFVEPLRQRAADIPLLARHLTLVYARKLGKRIESIPPANLSALCSYHWPGNVRELQNVIERAVIVSPGPVLQLDGWSRADHLGATADMPITLEALEREHILRVLDHTNWRVSGTHGAAAILGLKPTTLESRMKKLGIARQT